MADVSISEVNLIVCNKIINLSGQNPDQEILWNI